jgi:outer membrane protein
MKNILIVWMSLVFSGCAVMHPTDPYKSVHTLSPSVSAPKAPASSVMLPEESMTLQQAVEIGLANNPGVAALAEDTAAADARQSQALSERMPKLSTQGSYTRHLDEQRILPVRQPGEPAILSRDILSGDIVLTLPLFTGGRLINQVKAADLLHQATAHRLSRSKEELVFNISSVFFRLLAQEHVIESIDFSQQVLEEHIKNVNALIEARKAAKVDRLRTEVRLADVRQQLVQEKNLLTIQRRILANFLGLNESIGHIALQGELELNKKSTVPELESALDAARKNRNDYLAAKADLEAQARNMDAARAGYWPVLFLQGVYGGRLAAGRAIGTGDEYGDIGHVALAVEIPLFKGGEVSARIREQLAVFRAAQERFRELDLQVQLEIETALSNVTSSEERVEAIQKSIQQARESLRIEKQKYELGRGAIVDVLDAQAALQESESTYYRVLSDFHTARAQFKLAVGEGEE